MTTIETGPELNGRVSAESNVSSPDERSVLAALPLASPDLPTASPPNLRDDAEPAFDALHALTRLLVGGALEGADELARRLTLWEAFLRAEMAAREAAATDATNATTETDPSLLRHALVGLIFEGGDQARQAISLAWRFQKAVAKTAVRTTRPLTHNRLTQPLHHRLDRAAQRGQDEIVRWIQRGQAEEPFSRELARLAVAEIVDELISQLADNREVQELIQQQSVGLATEMVDQVRERTFTADTIVERIARAVTRRTPRLTPPAADLSELPPGTLTPGPK